MGVARNDACESLYGQCCFGRLASWQLHMRDRTCRIGKLCSLTACHHQAFAGQLAYCTSLFAFRSTLFAHCCDKHQLLRSVRSSGIVSVCGCNNIAEPVHAASVKLCVTCGHSILCQLAFMCSGCWRLLLPPFLSHCLPFTFRQAGIHGPEPLLPEAHGRRGSVCRESGEAASNPCSCSCLSN